MFKVINFFNISIIALFLSIIPQNVYSSNETINLFDNPNILYVSCAVDMANKIVTKPHGNNNLRQRCIIKYKKVFLNIANIINELDNIKDPAEMQPAVKDAFRKLIDIKNAIRSDFIKSEMTPSGIHKYSYINALIDILRVGLKSYIKS